VDAAIHCSRIAAAWKLHIYPLWIQTGPLLENLELVIHWPVNRSRIEFPGVWPYSIYADEFVRRAVCNPGGGERSGLTAHFFFGVKLGVFLDLTGQFFSI
jgi:hypothetical protein